MDKRRKPAVGAATKNPRRNESHSQNITEIESATGIRYVKLHVHKYDYGSRESSGKELPSFSTTSTRAYQECLRFTSPEVKKYIFRWAFSCRHYVENATKA